jgi:hypothetical protein
MGAGTGDPTVTMWEFLHGDRWIIHGTRAWVVPKCVGYIVPNGALPSVVYLGLIRRLSAFL